MFDLSTYRIEKRRQIDAFLGDWLEQMMPAGRLREAMQYSLMADDKRLRPLLCMAAAEAVGGGHGREALTAGCALEMIHTYCLIHGDLPAMDHNALRRGKPTCHMQFDEATAILAGDALLAMAFQLLSDPEWVDSSRADVWLMVIQRISRSAGGSGMVQGQMRAMAAGSANPAIAAIEALHALKTGSLISAAVYAGAALGGGNIEQIALLESYAAAIALAFQIKEDMLDVEKDPELAGKSTFLSLMGLDAAKAFARQMMDEALQALASFDDRSAPLRAIANDISLRDSVD